MTSALGKTVRMSRRTPAIKVRFNVDLDQYVGSPRDGANRVGGLAPLIVSGATEQEVVEKCTAMLERIRRADSVSRLATVVVHPFRSPRS